MGKWTIRLNRERVLWGLYWWQVWATYLIVTALLRPDLNPTWEEFLTLLFIIPLPLIALYAFGNLIAAAVKIVFFSQTSRPSPPWSRSRVGGALEHPSLPPRSQRRH